MNNTPTPRTDEWEAYCDECYYHFWRLRRKTERGWYDGFHIHTGEEAKDLCDLLNKLETELATVTEQLKAAQNGWHDEITKGLSELKRAESIYTKAQERAERAIEQRDRLAEALRVINTYDPKNGQCDDGYTPVFHARKALAAVKGGADE